MVLIEYHLGLRQVVMALMNWAIDVPQKLLQSDARLFSTNELNIYFIIRDNIYLFLIKFIIERLIIHLFLIFIAKIKFEKKEELIIKKS